MKFRKKQVIIEAFQWTVDVAPDWWVKASLDFKIDIESGSVFIPTLEGVHEAKIYDFIIKGIAGELYPCKPDIFEKTYEKL